MTLPPLPAETFWGLSDLEHLLRVFGRLGVAALLGGLLGLEREEHGKSAGVRTHMLVALGAALFVLVPLEGGTTVDHLTRVIQGLTTAIGFLGGGVILKLVERQQIKGLTTAANLWVTAALGTAVGMGWVWPAVLTVVLSWIILLVVGKLEGWLHGRQRDDGPDSRAVH